MTTSDTASPVTVADVLALPSPGGPERAIAVARFLAAGVRLKWARWQQHPDTLPSRKDFAAAQFQLAAVHVLRTLLLADPAKADQAAREIAYMLRDGDGIADWSGIHCEGTGVDPGEVDRVAAAERVADGPESDENGRGVPGAGDEMPEVAQAELEALRRKVAEYENAIDWMTTCTSCAAVLDSSISELARAERAQGALSRLAAVIPPERFRKLADWFDTDDKFKVTWFPETWPSRGSETQDDLRKFAALLEHGDMP